MSTSVLQLQSSIICYEYCINCIKCRNRNTINFRCTVEYKKNISKIFVSHIAIYQKINVQQYKNNIANGLLSSKRLSRNKM